MVYKQENREPKEEMIIAIDFDGTCVTHEFPKVGRDIGATPVLKKLVEQGHKLILYTMRDNVKKTYSLKDGSTLCCNTLEDAVNWFRENDIPLFGINSNPTQRRWTKSPKIFAHLYIDDAALGIPLTANCETDRPYVDWAKVDTILEAKLCNG